MSTSPTIRLTARSDGFQFPDKTIALEAGVRAILGRQNTDNADSVATTGNGFFFSQLNNTPVSRVHAEVWSEGNEVFIQDLNSSNGTFVNDIELAPRVRTGLKTGDVIVRVLCFAYEPNELIIHRLGVQRLGIWVDHPQKEFIRPVIAEVEVIL